MQQCHLARCRATVFRRIVAANRPGGDTFVIVFDAASRMDAVAEIISLELDGLIDERECRAMLEAMG